MPPATAAPDPSRELKDSLDKPPPDPTGWSQRRNDFKDPPRSMSRIIESTFIKDPDAVYAQLEEGLRVGEKRSDYGTMMRALDEAETNARLAHRLYVTARMEHERWELENDVVFSAMWSEATGELQYEKDNNKRSKQITDADVKYKCSALFPEEYAAQEDRRRRFALTVKSLENLSSMWEGRCRSLQVMVTKQR